MILQQFCQGFWVEISLVLGIKLIIDLISILVLIGYIYLKNYRRTDLFLTFFSFNIIVFFISYLFNRVEMSTGAAFGLFAIFSILRYRTEGISARDMTYLFLCIAIGLIAAIDQGNLIEHIIIPVFVLLMTFLLESGIIIRNRACLRIVFDNTHLLEPAKRNELKTELEKRTGLQINHIEIGDIDYIKDTVVIHIYYDQK
jgi:hypothetical protein